MNARIRLVYLMVLSHAACMVIEKVEHCCNGSAGGKCRAEGCSYYNSFPLRFGYWAVPMILWDT